jgi:cell division protein FtsB
VRKKRYKYEIKLPEVDLFKLFIFIIFGIFSYFFISNSIVKFFFLKNQYKKLENQLNKLKEENSRLNKQLYLLQNDIATIEYYIRKELNYKKHGEKVIILKN